MTESLADEYPEAAPYIQQAVDEHGEDWVLAHYYEHLYPLGRVMAMPEKDELSFYDVDEHDTMTEEERVEMYQVWGEYRENFRAGTKLGKWLLPCIFSAVVVEGRLDSDQTRGILLGVACGDALGRPVEFSRGSGISTLGVNLMEWCEIVRGRSGRLSDSGLVERVSRCFETRDVLDDVRVVIEGIQILDAFSFHVCDDSCISEREFVVGSKSSTAW